MVIHHPKTALEAVTLRKSMADTSVYLAGGTDDLSALSVNLFGATAGWTLKRKAGSIYLSKDGQEQPAATKTYEWTGIANGNGNDSQNWSGDIPKKYSCSVYFNGDRCTAVTNNVGNINLTRLEFLGGAGPFVVSGGSISLRAQNVRSSASAIRHGGAFPLVFTCLMKGDTGLTYDIYDYGTWPDTSYPSLSTSFTQAAIRGAFVAVTRACTAVRRANAGLAGAEADAPAKWISGATDAPECPAPVLFRDFTLAAVPKKAEFTVAVAGWCEVRVNGRKIGRDVLSPVTCQPDKRLSSLTFDVTDALGECLYDDDVVVRRSALVAISEIPMRLRSCTVSSPSSPPR